MAAAASTSSSLLFLPGQPLTVPSQGAETGPGTYRRGEHILASLVGHEERPSSSTISVLDASSDASLQTSRRRFVVPTPGATVLGRVTRVTPRQANVSILVVDGQPCASGGSDWRACGYTDHAAGEDPTGADFTGVVRVQDVRATDKDKVRMGDCFRPGDIVRAAVLSYGDARSYFLSTAQNHLGVVYALPSPAPGAAPALLAPRLDAQPLIPVSWQEMQDPVTGTTEKRKVAKPE